MSPVEREGPERHDEFKLADGRSVTIKLAAGLPQPVRPTGTETRQPDPAGGDDPRPSAFRQIPPIGGVL